MELKKNQKADLESKKGIFLLIGLIIAESLAIGAIEYKTYNDSKEKKEQGLDLADFEDPEIDVTRPDPPPPEEKPPPPPEVPEEIEIKENEEELEKEVKVQDAGTDQEEMIAIEEEEFQDAFIVVEQMPMLGDCKDEECTQFEIMNFIFKSFRYPEIAKQYGIEGRIILEFVVEKDGKVGRVKILKTEKRWSESMTKMMEKAAIEAVEKFNSKKAPKFSPGKQTGKAVPVKYTVPIKCTLG